MGKTVTVLFEPDGRRVEVSSELTVLEATFKAGVAIRSECGGKGVCGKCRVVVQDKDAVAEVTEAERKFLSSNEISLGYRLACQAVLKNSLKVLVPVESRLLMRKIQAVGLEGLVELKPNVKKIPLRLPRPTLEDARPDLERLMDSLSDVVGYNAFNVPLNVVKDLPNVLRSRNWEVTVVLSGEREIISLESGDTSDKLFGFAVDIGTSKIVGCLVDLKTGKTVSVGFIENPQIAYGEDIISRVTFTASDAEKLENMQRLLVQGINNIMSYVCKQVEVDCKDIYEVTVVGNTVMHHFFLGINPKYVATSPFTPALKHPINVKARELELHVCSNANVHVLPVIAGFVGADAVADVLASGIHKSNRLSMLIDIGTNTEVFVGNSEDMLSCSCASGPAFEGGHIKHGMKAVTGAIERVSLTRGLEVEYKTVDDAPPVGICGSAMVDVVAELYRVGIINERGRFINDSKTTRLRKVDGDLGFVLVPAEDSGTGLDIVVTQRDINELQVAKAAIFAGCSVLMRRKNIGLEEIDELLVAGSFGSYINPENAKLIGLFPDIPTEKIKFVGNTALSGAKMALISVDARKTAETLARWIRYIELACDPDFPSEFADAMYIPHKKIGRFPQVKRIIATLREKVGS